MSHMAKDIFDMWKIEMECESWRVPHVGQEMLTLSGTPDFTSSEVHEFSLILSHNIYVYYPELVCKWKTEYSYNF